MLAYAASMGLSQAALIIGGTDPDNPDGPPSGGSSWYFSWHQWWDEESGSYVDWEDGRDMAVITQGETGINMRGDIEVGALYRIAHNGNQSGKFKILGENNSDIPTNLTINNYIQGGFDDGTKREIDMGRNLHVHGDFEVRNTSYLNFNDGATIHATITMADSSTGIRVKEGADLSQATLRMNGHALDFINTDASIKHLSGNGRFFTSFEGGTTQTLKLQNLTIGANADGSGGLGSWVQSGNGALNVEFGGGTVAMTVEMNTGLSDTFQIKGQLTLGGHLVINTLGTGVFQAGDSYTLFTADGGITGEFDSITLPDLDDGLEWVWENTGNSWTITVQDKIPEPAAIMLLGLGGVATIMRRRRVR